MSERPNNPNDEQTSPAGGWHTPLDTSPWQASDTGTQGTVKWQEVKALPDDVDRQPAQRGVWHLPDDADTIYNPDDVIEITEEPRKAPTTSSIPAARPEDLLAEIVGGTQRGSAVPNPEDFDYSTTKGEEATASADALGEGETQIVDEEEATSAADALPDIDMDDEDFSFTEYMALASLAQGDDDDMAGIQSDDLSPAARAAYTAALNVTEEMDSKRLKEDAVPDDATETLQDTGQLSAADYAAQQLAQLEQGNTAVYGGQEQQAPQRQYTQEEIQLANQFRETKRQVAVLRQMRDAGQIDQYALQTELQKHQIYTDNAYWMIGLDSDEWYRYNDQIGDWEKAEPPVPLDAGQALTETGFGAVAPDVQTGSLPYLPQDDTQGTGEYSQTNYDYDPAQYDDSQRLYAEQHGVSDNTVPYTNQPVNDPNLTQVGNSADWTHQTYAEPTLQNLNMVDQSTIESDAYDGQNTVPSASIGDMASDGYNYDNQGIPQADPGFQDSGFNDYQAQSAPDIAEIERGQNRRLLAIIGFSIFGLVIFALILFGGFVLFAMNQYNTIVGEWQDEIAGLVEEGFDFQTATILAADGTTIAELTGEAGQRTVVHIEDGEVSPFFVHAIVSSEDPRFYENPGFDVVAIGRAFLQNFFAGEVESGASTITQQIVRERILGSNVVSFDRKLTEVLLSMEVARTYTKNQILDIYINEFFYGEQSYGVEAAAQFYFDTSAAELNAAESATLVGILPSPSSANPVVAPADAFSNMRVILERMVERGCIDFQHEWRPGVSRFCFDSTTTDEDNGNQVQLFTQNAAGEFQGLLLVQIAEVETRRYQPRQSDIQYPHFVFYTLGELDAAYGRGAYIERGFTVQTTLIPRIQNTSEIALRQGVDALELSGAQTGAAIVIDPRTGAIVAMVGSPDFNDEEIDGQNNNTISYQQPGSAIKPVVYATALRANGDANYLTPASILWDVRTQFTDNGVAYDPTNFDNRYRGPVPVRYALAQSLNVPAVKAYRRFGNAEFVQTAGALGINFDPDPTDAVEPVFGLPTAIGATEVSLMDLTHAYATIANDGVRNDLYVVESITEDGANVALIENLLHGPPTEEENAVFPPIDAQTAYLLQNILSDDVARSSTVNGVPSTFPANSIISGSRFGLSNRDQVAAKTGTNNTAGGNPSRIWTVGFTNNYAVGVWMGPLNQGTAMTGNVTGFTGAAPVWEAIMRETINGGDPGSFNNPGGVVQDAICQLTGTLSPDGANCPTRITELYTQSQPPPAADQGFVATINIDSWTGLRSNEWCADHVVSENFANIQDAYAVQWLNTTTQGQQILNLLGLPANLPAPPADSCQQGQALPTVLINFPQENTNLEGVVPITGQISAGALQRWELQISEVGTDNFRSIMPGPSTTQMPTGGSILYEWDTTSVQNGAYILRLAAFSNVNGGFILREVRVNIVNPEPTPLPASPTPFVIETVAPLPFDIPTATP